MPVTVRSDQKPAEPHARFLFFFFTDTATTEIYTLSLHDALPISPAIDTLWCGARKGRIQSSGCVDRKSTRLNSSHGSSSYAVFCLKKKKSFMYSCCCLFKNYRIEVSFSGSSLP